MLIASMCASVAVQGDLRSRRVTTTVAGVGSDGHSTEHERRHGGEHGSATGVDQEMERTDRLAEHSAVRQAGEVLKTAYDAGTSEQSEDGDWAASPATVEVVRRLPDELQTAGVRLDEEFAASAAHFEGWGALAVLQEVADPHLLAALEAREELPAE
jgi:hypothetical protein